MAIELKLEAFNGPLDLLLHLIEKNKVSIYDIPIALITQQYMEYIDAMTQKNLQMDVMSEFLVMAATLLDIKSRMLLPAEKDEEGEEIDPREELVERLVEYKTYKLLAGRLTAGESEAEQHLYKGPTLPKEVLAYKPEVDLDELLENVTLKRMQQIFNMLMNRQAEKIDPVRSRFGTITRNPVKLGDKINHVFEYAKNKKKFSFMELMVKEEDRHGLVVTFLAVLELMKIGAVTAVQEETFGDIELEWISTAQISFTKEELEQYD